MRAALGIVMLGLWAVRATAECNMTTADNTWHAGLDINDTAAENQNFIRTVEQFHFSSEVESLHGGMTAPLPRDIEYTLNSVPNHYRALAAYAKWEIANPRLARIRARSAECYFKRAIGFRPDDAQLHVIFGTFLHRAGRIEEAAREYDTAEQMGSGSAELFYNRGLLEFDRGNIKMARSYAERAYALGYPLPGLKRKLDGLKGSGK